MTLGYSQNYLGLRELDKREIDAALARFNGWKNVLELIGITYAVSGRDGTAEALPLMIEEAKAKRDSVYAEPDSAAPMGFSADFDAINDLRAFADRAEGFVYVNLRPNLMPGKLNHDGWNYYDPNVPKTQAQDAAQMSLQQIINATLKPYEEAAAAALAQPVPATPPPPPPAPDPYLGAKDLDPEAEGQVVAALPQQTATNAKIGIGLAAAAVLAWVALR